MTDDISTSGFYTPEQIDESFNGFTDVCVMPSAGYNLLAKAKRRGRWWWLKGLKKEYRQSTIHRDALHKEYDVLCGLKHRNVVEVFALEEVEGLGECIVMEYIEGTNLRDALKEGLPHEVRLRIANEMMEALSYIHSKQVVHRDLKPSNVMLTQGAQYVKLIDFGLSDGDMYTILKQPSGTAAYMSPEQKTESVPDVRNDIYSLGRLMEDLHLGRRYQKIIAKCQRPIAERYPSVEALRKDFMAVQKTSPLKVVLLLTALLTVVLGLGIHYHWTDSVYRWARTIHLTDYDFEEKGLFFNVLDKEQHMVEVTNNGSLGSYEGDIFIPAEVEHNDEKYTVVQIGDYAFKECRNIIAITFPPTLERIGEEAFVSCDSLTTINLGDNIKELGDNVFKYCSSLCSIRFSRSLTRISGGLVCCCGELREITLHEGLISLEKDAFAYLPIDSITLPQSLRAIERGVFWWCPRLKHIRIPRNVERIGDYVFWHCNSLRDVYVEWPKPLPITDIFKDLHGVRLHVPRGSADAYRRAEGWNVLDVTED